MPTAVVCGFSPVGTSALAGLLKIKIKILKLYTYEQKPDELWFEPPAVLAKKHGIPVTTEPFNTDKVYAEIKAMQPDFLFSFYFREMIPQRFLDIPKLGAMNLHGSLLPKYRGRAPINWVILHGETETGMTLHYMLEKPDAGDIVAQERISLDWDETALSSILKGAAAANRLVVQSIPRILAGETLRISQSSLGTSTYFGGRKPADGKLDFTWSQARAFNMIRAVADPWPNAFIETERGSVQISWALPTSAKCLQGHFSLEDHQVLLGFADGALCVHALRRFDVRSERPTDHMNWLSEIGIPQA
ncbi:MAG: formyltransferase [Gammaproteobacteria bacterium]|nr:formyltransferase [Gammaproteobacteria bacterium]